MNKDNFKAEYVSAANLAVSSGSEAVKNKSAALEEVIELLSESAWMSLPENTFHQCFPNYKQDE